MIPIIEESDGILSLSNDIAAKMAALCMDMESDDWNPMVVKRELRRLVDEIVKLIKLIER